MIAKAFITFDDERHADRKVVARYRRAPQGQRFPPFSAFVKVAVFPRKTPGNVRP